MRMLKAESFAVLAPWRPGGGVLSITSDARRISKAMSKVCVTNRGLSRRADIRHENSTVVSTLRESEAHIRKLKDLGGWFVCGVLSTRMSDERSRLLATHAASLTTQPDRSMSDARLIERWLTIAALGIESTRERTPIAA